MHVLLKINYKLFDILKALLYIMHLLYHIMNALYQIMNALFQIKHAFLNENLIIIYLHLSSISVFKSIQFTICKKKLVSRFHYLS
jgi:hypothetical protein